MERIMDSAYGVIVFYLLIAVLTFVVTLFMKQTNESNEFYENSYVAYETANENL